jgi:hypothetical protein
MFEDILITEKAKELHCSGGCGKYVELETEHNKNIVKWTCIQCIDKEVEDYV